MQKLSVVVVHGSYSEAYRREFTALMAQVQAQVDHPILGAYLECTELTLTAAIARFLQQQASTAERQLHILPLFLSPGVHVREDIPAAIAPLMSKFPAVKIKVLDYLGAEGRLAPFLEPQFAKYPAAKRVLLAHGSRRTGANPKIETFARSLQAITAYWATAPNLTEAIATMTDHRAICVIPYFLFSGKIPAAIAEQVQQLQQDYPQTEFHLGQPFGTQPDCAAAISQILQQ
ncbi:MAG: sirohydrochlorin chelatase [Limnothrix sp.]